MGWSGRCIGSALPAASISTPGWSLDSRGPAASRSAWKRSVTRSLKKLSSDSVNQPAHDSQDAPMSSSSERLLYCRVSCWQEVYEDVLRLEKQFMKCESPRQLQLVNQVDARKVGPCLARSCSSLEDGRSGVDYSAEAFEICSFGCTAQTLLSQRT